MALLAICLTVPVSFGAELSVMVLGDSLSTGHGIAAEESWVALLERRLRDQGLAVRIINASISGETTSGGALRSEQLLARHAPTVLLVELGGNDGLRGVRLEETRANLLRIITTATRHSVQVLLLGMRLPPNYGPDYTRAFHQIYLDLDAQTASALVPFFLEGVGDDQSLMQADGIHPTSAAQPQLLDNVWPQLLALLGEARHLEQ